MADSSAPLCDERSSEGSARSEPWWKDPRNFEIAGAMHKAEMERDASRYRWLRDRGEYFIPPEGSTSPWAVVGTGHQDCRPCSGERLDAAIDAAMKPQS